MRLSLASVIEVSFFVKRTLAARFGQCDSPEALEGLRKASETNWERSMMLERLRACESVESLDIAMRRLRQDVFLSLATRDITGLADYSEVVSTMTTLAEVTISACVRQNAFALARRYGVPSAEDGTPVDFLVVGMGKLGGEELNVSSDVDLVFVYDEAGETRPMPDCDTVRRTLSNHEFFTRLAKCVIASLDGIDENGFVFRVDMRLRPFGDCGPIVISNAMLEEYLYTEARDWERFAWLKGRIVNEPVFCSKEQFELAGDALMALVRPFVFRKYVDFSAIDALSRIHTMIRSESIRREANAHAGMDIKLGRGGIREIEFIAQTFELIRGGRDRRLQVRSSLAALPALAETGCLEKTVCERLADDYVFLRNLEHALQYVDDKQTHALPVDEASRLAVARMLGLTREELLTRLSTLRDFVSETFDGIFHTQDRDVESSDWPMDWSLGSEEGCRVLERKLAASGFADSRELTHRIAHLMQLRPVARNRECFIRLLKTVCEKAHDWASVKEKAVSQDLMLERMLNLLEVISGRSTYVALLNQYPNVAQKVGRLLASSRWASDFLIAHPILLDELVDARENTMDTFTEKDWRAWSAGVRHRLQEAEGDYEVELDLLREAQHGAIFRLLLRDLEGAVSVEHLADQLSALADAVVQIVLEMAWSSIATRHTQVPKIAVIGYGKLGGKELGYASDLDLVFIYEDDHPDALENYVKLVRRMTSWLSVQTVAGSLYAVDLRLRPNGESGLAAVDLAAFKAYQHNREGARAWVWEQQALTRARWCAGDASIGEAFEAERKAILMEVRDEAMLKAEIVRMREKMREAQSETGALFDVKHGVGGMIDVEFAVQAMVLTASHDHPEFTRNLGNSALLGMAADAGIIERSVADRATCAYRHYRDLQQMSRLDLGEDASTLVVPESVQDDRQAVRALWEAVF